MHVNEAYDLAFEAATRATGVVRVNISDHLVAGLNVVQFNVVGRGLTATSQGQRGLVRVGHHT